MRIQSLSMLYASKFSNSNKQRNIQTSFRSQNNTSDSFFKSEVYTQEKYEEQQRINPNTAFIYNPNLTPEQKQKMIDESPILTQGHPFSEKTNLKTPDWYNRECFVFDSFFYERPKKSPQLINVYDLTIPINKKNFDKLEQNAPNLLSFDDICAENNIWNDYLRSYINRGHLRPFTLTDKNGQKERNIRLVDVTDPINIEGLERLKKLAPITVERKGQSPYPTSKISCWISIPELSRLGFGEQKELLEHLKAGRLKGKLEVVEKEDGTKKLRAAVDINRLENQDLLEDVRTFRCEFISDLAQKTGINIETIENEILNGNFVTIKDLLSIGRKKEPLINIEEEQNAQTLEKLLFEKNVADSILQAEKDEKEQLRKDKMSVRMRLTWHLCPQTKSVVNAIFSQDKTIAALSDRKKELENYIAQREDGEDNSDLLQSIQSIEKEIEVEMKKLYKTMWNICGTEEYKNALAKSKEFIEIYEKKGLSEIEDKEIRNILAAYKVKR